MVEDSVEKEFDEKIRLATRRKAVGWPSQKQINLVMQREYPLLKSDLMGILGEQSEALRHLTQYKSDVQKNVGKKMSRPFICATFLNRNLTVQSMNTARNADSKNKIEQFRFLFDFAIGSELVLNGIIRAEDELSNHGEDQRQQVTSYISKTSDKPTSEITEEYLYIKREDAGLVELLRKDPSGFLLVDSLVERVTTDTDLSEDLCAKEYLLAGAELARDLYKKFYEIAAPLYPAKQSK